MYLLLVFLSLIGSCFAGQVAFCPWSSSLHEIS